MKWYSTVVQCSGGVLCYWCYYPHTCQRLSGLPYVVFFIVFKCGIPDLILEVENPLPVLGCQEGAVVTQPVVDLKLPEQTSQ